MKSLRENLLTQFSLAAFVVMLLLGGGITWFLSHHLGEIIQLVEAHGTAMSRGPIDPSLPYSIDGISQSIYRLRDRTILVFTLGSFVLYTSLVAIVFQGWRTIQDQREELIASNKQLLRIDRERELLLQTERENRALADSLRRVGLALSATLDLKDLLDHICRESMELLGVEAAYLWLVRDNKLVGFAGFGAGREAFLGLEVPLDDPMTLGPRVVRQERPIYVNHCRRSDRVSQALIERFNVEALLGVPLISKDKAIGALMMIETEHPDRFTEEDVELAEVLASHGAVAIDNAQLFDDLERAYDSTLAGWSRALELRDHETEGHTQRVAAMTVQLARTMGIGQERLTDIRRGALLHDIGKMAIPDRILRKPGKLTEAEWKVMRKHPEYARDLLEPIEYLGSAIDIPYCHHEKWDGSGYPRGLEGEEIPLPARIFAVVDVYDALVCDRPYRPAWPEERALNYIEEQSGHHFEPRVAHAFLGAMPELVSPEVLGDAPQPPCRQPSTEAVAQESTGSASSKNRVR